MVPLTNLKLIKSLRTSLGTSIIGNTNYEPAAFNYSQYKVILVYLQTRYLYTNLEIINWLVTEGSPPLGIYSALVLSKW